MGFVLPDRPWGAHRDTITATTTLTSDNMIEDYDYFAIAPASAATVVTLPTPASTLKGYIYVFINDSDGTYDVSLSCTNGFLSNEDSLYIAPNETIMLACKADTDGAFRWCPIGAGMLSGQRVPIAYTPTGTWDTAPADVAYVGRYRYLGPNLVWAQIYASGSDGDGRTPSSLSLPVTPANNGTITWCSGGQLVNATYTDLGARIVQNDATAGNRVLAFGNAQACTDSQAYNLCVTCIYEV